MPIGPQLPPHLQNAAAGADSDSDDGYGPQLPPGFAKQQQQRAAVSEPAFQFPSDSASEDDDIGPAPAPASARESTDGVKEFLEREARLEKRKREEEDERNAKPKRADWMLNPPKDSDLLSSMDPTKLKSRQFSSVQDTNKAKQSGPSALWTETPAEKVQRLEEEASGKRKKLENSAPETEESKEEARRKRKRDAKMAAAVDKYNKSARNDTLVNMHETKQKATPKEEDTTKAPVIWDRDTMIGSSARMDDSKRRKFIKEAASETTGLKSRFGSSGFA